MNGVITREPIRVFIKVERIIVIEEPLHPEKRRHDGDVKITIIRQDDAAVNGKIEAVTDANDEIYTQR